MEDFESGSLTNWKRLTTPFAAPQTPWVRNVRPIRPAEPGPVPARPPAVASERRVGRGVQPDQGYGAATSSVRSNEETKIAPLLTTPNHPEYPAAHPVITSAMTELFSTFLGTNQIRPRCPRVGVGACRTLAPGRSWIACIRMHGGRRAVARTVQDWEPAWRGRCITGKTSWKGVPCAGAFLQPHSSARSCSRP
jgi:hypothetical protein